MADLVDLVVIGYPDEATAEKAYEVVLGLEHDLVMQVAGAAVVVKHADGKAKMVTKTGATRAGAMMGGFFGLLFGLLFLIPVGGLILGGIMGAVMGTLTGWGIKDDFRQRVQDVLKPGSAALVLFIKKWTEDKALAALAPLGGERSSRHRSPMRPPKRSTTPSKPIEASRRSGDQRSLALATGNHRKTTARRRRCTNEGSPRRGRFHIIRPSGLTGREPGLAYGQHDRGRNGLSRHGHHIRHARSGYVRRRDPGDRGRDGGRSEGASSSRSPAESPRPT
jgi:uncharacterized membrane protein